MPDTASCALTKLECDDPANFRSSRQMKGGPNSGHGGQCLWQDAVQSNKLGMCFISNTSTPTQCASQVEACSEWDLTRGMADLGSGFVDKVSECTVETTAFGRCNDGMCAWSPEHCSDDTSWTPFDETCTCDKVQIGACSRPVMKDGREGLEVFCAVSEDACDAEQSWIVPQEVMNMAEFDCFLCREDSPSSPVTATSKDPPSSSSMGLIGSENNELGNDGADLGDMGGINAQTVVIIVLSVGVVIALSIIGLIGWKFFGTRRVAKLAAKAREHDTPPFSTISIPSDNSAGKDCEFGHNTDTDNASVLSDGSQQ